jgi:hypothetical protein
MWTTDLDEPIRATDNNTAIACLSVVQKGHLTDPYCNAPLGIMARLEQWLRGNWRKWRVVSLQAGVSVPLVVFEDVADFN